MGIPPPTTCLAWARKLFGRLSRVHATARCTSHSIYDIAPYDTSWDFSTRDRTSHIGRPLISKHSTLAWLVVGEKATLNALTSSLPPAQPAIKSDVQPAQPAIKGLPLHPSR